MSKPLSILVLLLVSAFFGVFFLYPVFLTTQQAFLGQDGGFTTRYVEQVFENEIYREGLSNAFWIAVASTLLSFVIALPLAYLANRFVFPAKGLFSSLILVPLILPPFVGAIGLKQFLGVEGSLNAILENLGLLSPDQPVDWLSQYRVLGIVLMNALHLYPILYLNLSASLANLDPAMEEAATNLKCPPWRKFFRITVPLTMPGIFAGGAIVFIWSFTELGVPLIFDYTRVTPVQIFDGLKEIGSNPFPYALIVIVLLVSVLLFSISKIAFGGAQTLQATRASVASAPKQLSLPKGLAASGLFAFVFAAAVIPHLGVIFLAFSTDWYGTLIPESLTLKNFSDALGDPMAVPSIQNSLLYASLSTFLDLILGIAIAYVIVRTTLPGRQLLDIFSMLPLAVPGLVLAFGYLAMSREGEPLSWMRIGDNPILLLVIAYAVRRLPYVVRSAAAGFQQTPVMLEEAAQNLGCTPLRAMQKITLPLIVANLIAGCLLAFSFAMLEVSDSLILAQKSEHYPITKAIYELFGTLGNGHLLASALGVWAMVFLAICIFGASIVLGKKLGSLFRV
ncbi:MAG: iron ABC transporter permease [Verrucomicrobiota bacterium]